MPLLKDDQFIADDWKRVDDETAIDNDDDVIVSPARLLREYQAVANRSGRLGVELANDQRPGMIEAFLPGLSLIVLPFPKFADGRAYSQARQLRSMGFDGELRASGDVLPDQLAHMREVGFNTFEVADSIPLETWRKAAELISLRYQTLEQHGREHIWLARARASATRANGTC